MIGDECMYICEDEKKLEQYRNKLKDMAGDHYPVEVELPLIYVEKGGAKKIELQAMYGEPYYDEIDINLISETNTSEGRKVIYSNYERVIRSIPYVKDNKCKPISVLKDGDAYYIENGKHRYLAHIILGKEKIPVSIKERVEQREEDNDFIRYKRKLFSDDGTVISYPEQVMEFYKENKQMFTDIRSVEMQRIEGTKKYILLLTKSNEDVIEISNGVSAGNDIRSSMVAMRLIKECGYDVDEEFIKTHCEFVLKHKYDANNLVFHEMLLSDNIVMNIRSNIDALKRMSEENESKLFKLHSFLCKYESFSTGEAHLEIFQTGELVLNNLVYYLISSEDKNCSEKVYTYVFMQEKKAESNLDTKYMGRILSERIFASQ